MFNSIRNGPNNLIRLTLSDKEPKSKGVSRKSSVNLYSPSKSRLLRSVREINNNKEDNEKYDMLLNMYKNSNTTPADLCCKALSLFPKIRYREILNIIKEYFTTLVGIMDIIAKETNKEKAERILMQVLMSIQLESYQQNNIIFKYGESGEKFYIVLRGKVGFLLPKLIKCNLNEEEYLEYLIKLKKNKEDELVKKLLSVNQQYYDLGNDLEYFIRERLYNFENKIEDTHHYSMFLYKKLKLMTKRTGRRSTIRRTIKIPDSYKIDLNIKNKTYEEIYNNDLTIENYINSNKVNDMELPDKDRKNINVYLYVLTNVYEDGQTFGYDALENKINKRVGTIITLKNTEFAVLSKDIYLNLLQPLNLKYREMLFNLVNSNNLLGYVSKKTFDKRICHMFKFVKYKMNDVIFSDKKRINSVQIFNSGQFNITINKNIIDMNYLMIKLKKIRGKILGRSAEKIEKEIEKNIFNIETFKNQKYIAPEILKLYNKKYELVISIINDNLVSGLYDTVDPETYMPLFDCKCVSHFCEGYEISIDNLESIHNEYFYDIYSNQLSLIKLDYYINRLEQYKIDIENKIEKEKKDLKMDIIKKNILKENSTLNKNENENINNNDCTDIRRNTLIKIKNSKNKIAIVKLENKSSSIDDNQKRFNTVDITKNKLSKKIFNINDKRYNQNNLNTISNEKNIKNSLKDIPNEENKNNKKNLYYDKIKKRIKDKEHLLKEIKQQSNKYLKEQKLIMRQIYRCKKSEEKMYYNISDIFNNNTGNDKSKKTEQKDLLLDNMKSNIDKNGKYDRILSSFMTSNNEKKKKNSIKYNKSSADYQFENFVTEINNDPEKKIEMKKNISYVFPKLNNSGNKNLINQNMDHKTIDVEISNTLPGIRSIADKNTFRNLNRLKINKIENKFRNFDNFKKKSIENKKNIKDKPSLISIYDKNMVSVIDPLILNKFNYCYQNNKLKQHQDSFN